MVRRGPAGAGQDPPARGGEAEVSRKSSATGPPAIYPGPDVIRPGRPLVIVEGEFDALLLGQELGDLAAVVTLGSASARPDPGILGSMLAAAPWFIATDADEAGDKAAVGLARPARGGPAPRRSFKDLDRGPTKRGVNLRRWWSDRLGGTEAPPLFTWEELAALRWGPARWRPEPGIVIDRPDRGRMLAALKPPPMTPRNAQAIQAENVCGLDNRLSDNEGDGGGPGWQPRPPP